MLPETHQVLLLNKNRGTHVVAEAGQDVDGFLVDEIGEDEVTLVAPSGAEVILAAPDMTWRRRAAERRAAARKGAVPAAAIVTTPGIASDASTDGASAGPVDPYAEPPAPSASSQPHGPIRSASASGTPAGGEVPAAPADPYAEYDEGIAAFVDAVGAQPVPPAPSAAPKKPAKAQRQGGDMAGALAAAATGEPAAPTAPQGSATALSTTVSRADIDAALSDFGATAVTFDAKFVAEGLRIDSIAAGTILAKAGLEKGDTITAVDGKPLRSFDDAADLYARMQTAKAATISVQRGGKPVMLKVAIR